MTTIESRTISLSGPAIKRVDTNSPVYQDLLSITSDLARKDASLWGVEARTEAEIRLNWIDLPTSSRELLPSLDALSAWARSRNLTELVLCGMGGSSLAPEVLAKSYRKKLTVLDSTDPLQVQRAIPNDLSRSLFVIGSKSGSTIETSSQRAYITHLLTENGYTPQDHMVIVTDPDSPLDRDARAQGYRVVNADPHVGGRFSALSAFGLVPAALMGIDAAELLDDAEQAASFFTLPDSPAVALAALLFESNDQFVAFSDSGSALPGLSDWIEQLVAESTGKNHTGRLPVVIESTTAEIAGNHLKIAFAADSHASLIVEGNLGAQFILWEWVTALLGRALNVDPFNQPNVTEAKDQTNKILATATHGTLSIPRPSLSTEHLDVYTTLDSTKLSDIFETFLGFDAQYFAVMAYLTRGVDDQIAQVRETIARKTGKPVTFGWGPRFLHSTGQFHKGGQPNGAFLQLTGENQIDLAIPGKDFGFATLVMAQALGDGKALAERNFPLLRVHLKKRAEGIQEILDVLK